MHLFRLLPLGLAAAFLRIVFFRLAGALLRIIFRPRFGPGFRLLACDIFRFRFGGARLRPCAVLRLGFALFIAEQKLQ